MADSNVLSKVADATLQQPVLIEVDIIPINIVHRYLQRWKLLPCKRRFTIRPICFGSLIRISRLILSIDVSVFDLKNLLDSNYKAIEQHAGTMAEVVAVAIQNDRHEPSRHLVNFILRNFTAQEMQKVMAIVLQQMNVTSFMTSIISMRGMNVLDVPAASASNVSASEVSPMDRRS